MNRIYILLTLIIFLTQGNKINAQTIWTGPTTTFTKSNNTDWTMESNQDRITNNVWITRANTQGIFNIVTESNYTDFSSPADTEWAIGTTANIGSLTFQNWEYISESNPPNLVNQDMVVHLITDDIYIDIKFKSWTTGETGGGGGFSYERSTDQGLSISQFDSENSEIFPNPSSIYIKVKGTTSKANYKVYNVLGKQVSQGVVSENEKINIENLTKGLYFLNLNKHNIMKFVKK